MRNANYNNILPACCVEIPMSRRRVSKHNNSFHAQDCRLYTGELRAASNNQLKLSLLAVLFSQSAMVSLFGKLLHYCTYNVCIIRCRQLLLPTAAQQRLTVHMRYNSIICRPLILKQLTCRSFGRRSLRYALDMQHHARVAQIVAAAAASAGRGQET
jgi:hypothetical protein